MQRVNDFLDLDDYFENLKREKNSDISNLHGDYIVQSELQTVSIG